MTTFEFVSVLLSIVVSLAFTHLLTGAARLIAAEGVKLSLVHVAWMGLLTLSSVDYWFSLWQARNVEVWSLGYVMLWLALATALYVASWLAVPSEAQVQAGADLANFHDTRRRKYLGAFFVYMAFGLIGNLTVATLESASLVSMCLLVLIAIAWIWSDRRVQIATVVIFYVVFGWYAMTYIPQV